MDHPQAHIIEGHRLQPTAPLAADVIAHLPQAGDHPLRDDTEVGVPTREAVTTTTTVHVRIRDQGRRGGQDRLRTPRGHVLRREGVVEEDMVVVEIALHRHEQEGMEAEVEVGEGVALAIRAIRATAAAEVEVEAGVGVEVVGMEGVDESIRLTRFLNTKKTSGR